MKLSTTKTIMSLIILAATIHNLSFTSMYRVTNRTPIVRMLTRTPLENLLRTTCYDFIKIGACGGAILGADEARIKTMDAPNKNGVISVVAGSIDGALAGAMTAGALLVAIPVMATFGVADAIENMRNKK